MAKEKNEERFIVVRGKEGKGRERGGKKEKLEQPSWMEERFLCLSLLTPSNLGVPLCVCRVSGGGGRRRMRRAKLGKWLFALGGETPEMMTQFPKKRTSLSRTATAYFSTFLLKKGRRLPF